MQQVQVGKVQQLIQSVDLSALSESEQSKVICLLTKYQSVFATHEEDLGFTTLISHEIPLADEVPVRQRYRRIPPAEYDAVKAHKSTFRKSGNKGELQPLCIPNSFSEEKGWCFAFMCGLSPA